MSRPGDRARRSPRVARWLLTRLLSGDHADAIIGDLDEEYRIHVAPARGGLRARWWYWRQALGSISPSRRAGVARSSDVRPGNVFGLADLSADFRYALRSLRSQPGLAATAVLTLALGIGANTAIFSIAGAVLLRPLPYDEPGRLVHIWEFDRVDGNRRQASWPEYLDWQRLNGSFEQIAGYEGGSRTLTGVDGAERVRVAQVTGNFFRTLGVRPRLGRTFRDDESGRAAAPLVILTHDAWQQRFGADDRIIGEPITLNGTPHVVVGVLPAGFEFSLRGSAELYIPLQVTEAQAERRYQHWLDLIGRLRDGVTLEAATEDLSALAGQFAAEVGDWHAGVREIVVPLHDQIVAPVRPALLVLLGAVGVVLLVTCANVAGLLAARSATRARELSIRAALGAGRGRLLRQVMTEGVVLAFIGGAAGLLVGNWGLSALIAAMPERQRVALPHLRELSLDAGMVGIAAILTLLVGVAVGLAPALRAAGGRAQQALREGDRSATRRLRGVRPWLVGAEVMMAVVLVAGAGVLGKSLLRLLQESPGFDPNGVLTFTLSLPASRYQGAEQVFAFRNDLFDRVAALPGVEGAGTINQLPLTGSGNSGTFTVEGEPLVGGETNPDVNIRTVSNGYFRALGVPLLAGRALEPSDDLDAPPVVLVNRTLADRYFPERGPLGREIVFSFFDGQPAWEIVGVVGDERFGSLDDPITPVVYFPYRQTPERTFSVVMRTAVPPRSLIDAVRAEVAALDADLPVYEIATMNEIATGSTAVFLRRTVLILVGGFGALALLLAAVGLYGVLSQSVVERTREIGVRTALGADRTDVVRLVVRQGMVPAVGGLVAGIALALVALRYLGSLLYEVEPADPAVLLAVTLGLGTIAFAACWIPARRAARVDPIESLRAD